MSKAVEIKNIQRTERFGEGDPAGVKDCQEAQRYTF